jgi:hypothetical protein
MQMLDPIFRILEVCQVWVVFLYDKYGYAANVPRNGALI